MSTNKTVRSDLPNNSGISLQEQALSYAALDWHVFPVLPYRPGIQIGGDEYKAAKAPVAALVHHGHRDATTDPSVIKGWWEKVPRARIGLACKPSGIVVIDHDTYKDSAEALEDLPDTLTAETPQGGIHYYFRRPDGDWGDIRVPGIDLKGNGYVILPSVDSGGYAWVNNLPIADFPPAMVERFFTPEVIGPGPQTVEEVTDRESFLIEEATLRRLGDYRVKGEDARGRVLVELSDCPFDPTGHSAPWKAYIGIGSRGRPFAGCVMAGCAGRGWRDLPSADYSDVSWEEVRYSDPDEPKEWNGTELALADLPEISFLPLFGCDGYIPLGFTTILGAEPKAGKTTLLLHMLQEWTRIGHSILYVTEESERLWKPRLSGVPEDWGRLTLLPAYEASAEFMLERVRLAEEDIIVVDTARAVLRFRDENDNAGVEQTLRPWIQAARSRNKTLVVLHHARKGGGPLLEALSGAHALVGAFDQVLVLRRDVSTSTVIGNRKKRWVSGFGRFGGVQHLMYTQESDSTLHLEGLTDVAAWEQ